MLVLCLQSAVAQAISKTDYTRAVSFMWDNINNKKAFQLSINPNWFSDSTGFWYNHFSQDEKLFYKVTFKPLKKYLLFDHEQLAAKLGEQLKESVNPKAGAVRQLSTLGKKDYEYASYYGWSDIMEGEGGERPKRFTANWSGDSKWIETSISDLRYGRKMYLLDWSVDTLYRARLLSYL